MRDLASQLFASTNPNYTPDGHPITAILQHDAIERLFKA